MSCIICNKNNDIELIEHIHYANYEHVLAYINIANNNYDFLNNIYCKYCNFQDTLLTAALNMSNLRPYNDILDMIIKRIIECKKVFTLYEMNKLKFEKNIVYYNYFLERIKFMHDFIYNLEIKLPFELIINIYEMTLES